MKLKSILHKTEKCLFSHTYRLLNIFLTASVDPLTVFMTMLVFFNHYVYTELFCGILSLLFRRSFFDHSMHSALPLGIYLATKFWMYVTWFFWFWNDILSALCVLLLQFFTLAMYNLMLTLQFRG